MNNPLSGTRGMWLRQYSDTGEKSTDAILATMAAYNITAWWQKCADGESYQGTIDPLTPITGWQSCHKLQQTASFRGVEFCPVVVPRGRAIVAEAAAHADIAKECGLLCVDLEPGADYFAGSMDTIASYVRLLRQAAPQAYLILQPDGRVENLKAIDYDTIIPYFDAVAPQLYIGYDDHWMDVETEINRFLWFKRSIATVIPTLYLLGDLPSMMYYWNCIYPQVDSLCGFAFGSAGPGALSVFESLPLHATKQDTAFLESIAQRLAQLTQEIEQHTTLLKRRQHVES